MSNADRRIWTKTSLGLGTMVQIQVVTNESEAVVQQGFERAATAMRAVENACSRFDSDSELVRLVQAPVGSVVPVSVILFKALNFAYEVADWTDGRFDPTVAARMEELGFVQHYLTGAVLHTQDGADPNASYRDIQLDPARQTVQLQRPLRLDLGAVAKGMAVDLAVKELAAFNFDGYVVDAGGDIYAAGLNEQGLPWTIGIRHPLRRDEVILTLQATDVAICTSGTYERTSSRESGSHHILNAHSKRSARGFISGTAVGPYTMMTDAFSTAAFLYPPDEALEVLTGVGLEGVMITEDLQFVTTPGMGGYLNERI
jgi:thiamine biosynthesis lipoprotein